MVAEPRPAPTEHAAERRDGGDRRVELVHESLLTKWPRLVRWRTQDAEGAQLRDELRQAAQLWEQHGRGEDFLWTGTAYREYALWRERYPGGLTELEESFAEATASFASRRRKRRRVAVAAAFLVLLAVLAAVGILLRRSQRQTLRAEAAKLVALGQVELERNPTSALAHALASLELSDGLDARQLALAALWRGPPASALIDRPAVVARFTPDGQHLVFNSGDDHGTMRNLVVVEADGTLARLETTHTGYTGFRMNASGSTICSIDDGAAGEPGRVALWAAQVGHKLAEFRLPDSASKILGACTQDRAIVLLKSGASTSIEAFAVDGTSLRLGSLRPGTVGGDVDGRWIALAVGDELFVQAVGKDALGEPRSLGRQSQDIVRVTVEPRGRRIATADSSGEIRLWDPNGRLPTLTMSLPRGELSELSFVEGQDWLSAVTTEQHEPEDGWAAGSWTCSLWSFQGPDLELVRRVEAGAWGRGRWNPTESDLAWVGTDLRTKLWRAGAPADASPVEALQGDPGVVWFPAFHPSGKWLATPTNAGLVLWPLGRPDPATLLKHRLTVYGLAFDPAGQWLASASFDGTVRIWPLAGSSPPPGRILARGEGRFDLAASSDGRRLLVGSNGPLELLPVDGNAPKALQGFGGQTWGVAFSPDDRLAAAAGGVWDPKERVIRVWEIESGEEIAVLGPDENLQPYNVEFVDPDRILSGGDNGLTEWDLATGRKKLVYSGTAAKWGLSADRRRALVIDRLETGGAVSLVDLESGSVSPLASHGDNVQSVALGPRGDVVVTGGFDGVVRVGRATGEEPYLLLGHEQSVEAVALDPLGRWVASAGADATIRLWPMPDLSKPPLHTLARDELIAKLRTLTNFRVVRDDATSTGWSLTHDPFPGWETVPTW